MQRLIGALRKSGLTLGAAALYAQTFARAAGGLDERIAEIKASQTEITGLGARLAGLTDYVVGPRAQAAEQPAVEPQPI